LIFVGGYHALFVSGSDILTNLPLFLYFNLLGGSAAGLYIYRSLFHKSIVRKLEYTVHSVTNISNITIIWLKPKANALAFYAGQFAFFKFSSDAVDEESHPFTISSGSDNDNIRLAAKASGDYTSRLRGLNIGDSVQVEGPYGQFSFTKIRSTKQVWVAGGIGITPFLSMANSLPTNIRVTIYYCVQSLPQAIFLDELNNIALSKPGLKIVTVCSDQNQRLTAKDIAVDPADDYLLCAPPAMMQDLESQLVSNGVSKNNIHYEDFKLV
jgi:predicted ferric reductase